MVPEELFWIRTFPFDPTGRIAVVVRIDDVGAYPMTAPVGSEEPSAHAFAYPPVVPEWIAVTVTATADKPPSIVPMPATPATCTATEAFAPTLDDVRVSTMRPVPGVNPPPGLLGTKYPCTSTWICTVPPSGALSIVILPSEPTATCALIAVVSFVDG